MLKHLISSDEGLIAVGLDPGGPIRMVCLCIDLEEPLRFHLYDHYSFQDLESFQGFWQDLVAMDFSVYASCVVAAPSGVLDPLGVLEWLAERGVHLERFPVRTDIQLVDELLDLGLCFTTFPRAYSVAQTAAYRSLGQRLLFPLYDELRSLLDDVYRLRSIVHGLLPGSTQPQAPLGLDDDHDYDDIPF